MACPSCRKGAGTVLVGKGRGQIVECAKGHKFVLSFDKDDAEKRWLTVARVRTDKGDAAARRYLVRPVDAELD